MEEENIPMEENEYRAPRPAWQRGLAIVAVVIMIVGFLLYCWQIANGGT